MYVYVFRCILLVFYMYSGCICLYYSVFLDAMKCMQNTREYVFGFLGEYGQNTLRIHSEYTRIQHNKNTSEYIRVRITPYSGAKVLDPGERATKTVIKRNEEARTHAQC